MRLEAMNEMNETFNECYRYFSLSELYSVVLYPRRSPSDKGSTKQVQAENANAPHKSSDSGTDRLQDIQEEPRRCIGPSCVKELAKFFTPTSDEDYTSRVNNRTRRKKLFDPKKEEESEK